MQLLNILLFWLFFGFLGSYLAKKKGRNQKVWFGIGLLTGLLGVIVIWLLPPFNGKKRAKTIEVVATPLIPKNPSLDKPWFYLDRGSQNGPLFYKELLQKWETSELREESLVWSEGMEEWKKIKDLSDLHQELLSR